MRSLVAVAVMNLPLRFWLTVKEKERLPLRLVFMSNWYRSSSPSPKPEGSASVLEKNWMVKFFLGVLLSVHFMVVVVPSVRAEERTG